MSRQYKNGELSIRETARRLNIASSTAKHMFDNGAFPNAYKLKGTAKIVIPEGDIEAAKQRPFRAEGA